MDKRVLADHPLRKVAEQVDFSFVREAVKDSYGLNGNESVDPEIIPKLMFLLFWGDIRSECELMRMLPERLDYIWFLGYSLEDEVPDHSVLSKARRRWGPEVFESIFIGSVSQCVEAGLVDGSKICMDGSLIAANASKESVVKASVELIHQLRKAYGDVDEGTQVETLVDQHEDHTGDKVETAVGDSQYGSAEVLRTLQSRDIQTHVAMHGGAARKDLTIYPKSDFHYDVQKDLYRCPADQQLYRRRRNKRRKTTEYKTMKGVCAACHLKDAYTKGKHGRTIMRHDKQELIDRAADQSKSPQGIRDRIRRRYLIEDSFTQGANLHHFKRSRWRRLHRQQVQDWLICAIQNIKILIKHSSSPKKAAVSAVKFYHCIQLLDTKLYRLRQLACHNPIKS